MGFVCMNGGTLARPCRKMQKYHSWDYSAGKNINERREAEGVVDFSTPSRGTSFLYP